MEGPCGDIIDCHREQSSSAHAYHIQLLQYARCRVVLAKCCKEVQGFVPIVFAHSLSPQAFFPSFCRR